jgi:hypothetical protein
MNVAMPDPVATPARSAWGSGTDTSVS